jgi:hypothetical protein
MSIQRINDRTADRWSLRRGMHKRADVLRGARRRKSLARCQEIDPEAGNDDLTSARKQHSGLFLAPVAIGNRNGEHSREQHPTEFFDRTMLNTHQQ